MPAMEIPNLRNACLVLKYLARRQVPRRAADLARSLLIPRTSVIRILNSLEAEGMVRSEADGYRLGPALISLGAAAHASIRVREVARPFLSEVVRKTGETCHLAIPHQKSSMIIEVERSPHPLTATTSPGSEVDLHCSATGKIFLAYLHRSDLETFLRDVPLEAHTPNTLTRVDELARHLEQILSWGYALDEQEYFLGVRCIATPVLNHESRVIAALGMTTSIHRFPPERTDEVAAILREASFAISRELGAGA